MIRQVVSTFLGRERAAKNEERRDKTWERERGWEGEARGGKRGGASDVRIGSRENPWLLECGPLESGHIQVVQRSYSTRVPRTHRRLHVDGRARVLAAARTGKVG